MTEERGRPGPSRDPSAGRTPATGDEAAGSGDDRSGANLRGGGSRRPLLKLLALIALLAGGVAVARFTPLGDHLTRDGIGVGIEALRGSAWAPLIFISVYAAAVALAIPGTILTLAGGALFGVFWGSIINSIAANIGANLAFLIGRTLGRGGIERLVGARLGRLDRATENHGFQGLLTLRLIPLVPFNALNFGSGFTSIRWPTYALATAIGILPGTVVYTFFADALLQGSQEASREALFRVLLAGALLILLSLLPTILRKLRIKVPGAAALFILVTIVPTSVQCTSEEGGHSSPAGNPAAAASSVVPSRQAQQRRQGTEVTDATIPDHHALTALLDDVVEGSLVNYSLLKERREELDGYLLTLAEVDPRLLEQSERDAQLAFWINAYNACMLRRVVDHYPIRRGGTGLVGSIRNLVAGRPDNSVWQIRDVFTASFCRVAGELRSLDEIEHEIIRPTFDEPRIHFAVNCAARSCPPLIAEAYRRDRLDAQLDARVLALLADPEHFRIDREVPPVVRLNRVLDWYGEDFGGEEGLRRFLAGYLEGEERDIVLRSDTRIEYFDYDWTLNDTLR